MPVRGDGRGVPMRGEGRGRGSTSERASERGGECQ